MTEADKPRMMRAYLLEVGQYGCFGRYLGSFGDSTARVFLPILSGVTPMTHDLVVRVCFALRCSFSSLELVDPRDRNITSTLDLLDWLDSVVQDPDDRALLVKARIRAETRLGEWTKAEREKNLTEARKKRRSGMGNS